VKLQEALAIADDTILFNIVVDWVLRRPTKSVYLILLGLLFLYVVVPVNDKVEEDGVIH
jgi:hypothetical protein